MNPLTSRKRLLIAESELNRAQLLREWQTVADEVRALTERAKSVGAIASAATKLVSGLIALRRSKTQEPEAKASWPKRILQGAGWVSKIWLGFQALRREDKK